MPPAHIRLPHAGRDHTVATPLFVAVWRVIVDAFAGGPADWRTLALPRHHRRCTLAQQLSADRALSLDVLLRLLAPPSYRNTMQATGQFMAANGDVVQDDETRTASGRTVKAARLSSAALAAWDELPEQERERQLLVACALIDADVEAETDGRAELLGLEITEPAPRPLATAPASSPSQTRADFVRVLVEWIEREPFQPRYRRKSFGPPVVGWGSRLAAYFWPTPAVGFAQTARTLAPLLAEAKRLADALGDDDWSEADGRGAVAFAQAVFSWGGVPQPKPAPATVAAVFRSALTGREHAGAPMNSGWTKVAAFATAHLESEAEGVVPQVIWDSRVATAVTFRLDELLHRAERRDPRVLFPGVGTVSGRGGTRPRSLLLRWPSGYGRWDAQFAGSELVASVRDRLNESGSVMAEPDGGTAPWSVRGVEMVLFMDGY